MLAREHFNIRRKLDIIRYYTFFLLWLRTGSIPADFNRFRSDTGKKFHDLKQQLKKQITSSDFLKVLLLKFGTKICELNVSLTLCTIISLNVSILSRAATL